MRQLGIRIANLALFTLCCFLLADVFNKISADLLLPRSAAPRPLAPTPETPPRSWSEREPILRRNLFGAQLVSQPISEPEPEDIEETELPLDLLGTIASDNPITARAAIWDRNERRHQVLRVGDWLEHHTEVQLERVERRRVILRNGETREELRLEDRERAPEVASSREARSSSRGRESRRRSARSAPRTSEREDKRMASQLESISKELESGRLDEKSLAERLKALEAPGD